MKIIILNIDFIYCFQTKKFLHGGYFFGQILSDIPVNIHGEQLFKCPIQFILYLPIQGIFF